MDNLKEDTVSADRKERIIFDPEAWRKSDKSGRKTSAITSRQNFDNEKFTRKAKPEEVDESVIQPSGNSKVEGGGPEQSDTISKVKQKKSNSPQIEFVTGTVNPNGSSSTAIGNAQNMGIKKISEKMVKSALDNLREGKMGEKAAGDLDFNKKAKADTSPPWDTDGDDEAKNFKKPHNPTRSPMDTVRALAQKGIKKNVKEEIQHVEEACKEDKKSKKLKQEETTMSKTYAAFMEELDQLVEFVPEAIEEGIKIKTATGYIHKGTRGYGNDNTEFDQNDDFESDSKPKAKPAADAPKRGRGRPAGSYGTYKARSAETKAAAAAKSAATKAANKAK